MDELVVQIMHFQHVFLIFSQAKEEILNGYKIIVCNVAQQF